MDAIGLNPIKLDAIGLDPIRMNAIRLGVPGASSGSARPYIDPELLSHVKMAISTWGKTNDDPDRAVLKDLSGNGNDMRLLNFGFTGNSGYGMYGANYMDYTSNEMQLSVHTDTKISGYNQTDEGRMAIKLLVSTLDNIPSYKIKVTNLVHTIRYYYIDPENPSVRTSFPIKTNGVYELPASRNDIYNGESVVNVGFAFDGNGGGATIEQLPDFEGWLCTDGVDDIIESVKPVSEMLEGSNEITVVSIIHQISLRGISDIPLTNYIRESNIGYVRNELRVSLNKTGIYGYTCFNIQSPISSNSSVINNILGDKEDYRLGTYGKISNAKLSVQGFIDSSGAIIDTSQVAYAGGFIANKVLTTDEINQIIAYFNLDRPGQIIKPQLYCNVKKQGITNDNHAEFNDQLIDFVNGYNIQLNNISWEKQSGIGNYPISFKDYTYIPARGTVEINRDSFVITSNTSTANLLEVNTRTKVLPAYKVKIEGTSTIKEGNLKWRINTTAAVTTYIDVFEDGIYDIPATPQTEEAAYSGWCISKYNENVNVKVTILPEEGSQYALYLDGISDFGKATGLPILKDYTICALRKWLYGDSVTSTETGSIVSKSKVGNDGAFILEQTFNRNPSRSSTFSFGTINSLMSNDKLNEESFTYQTKYSYNGEAIVSGSGVDGDTMWLGTIRDGDSRFSKLALWSLMLFPYSLSEFLLERQLKKYKAGTLYPDMIEFRPVIKSNVPYSSISYSVNPGEYVTEGGTVTITITLSNASDKLVGVSSNAISDISISGDNGVYEVTGKVTKSPQKISIVISSYLTMLNNDTFISNETLIKNE